MHVLYMLHDAARVVGGVGKPTEVNHLSEQEGQPSSICLLHQNTNQGNPVMNTLCLQTLKDW